MRRLNYVAPICPSPALGQLINKRLRLQVVETFIVPDVTRFCFSIVLWLWLSPTR